MKTIYTLANEVKTLRISLTSAYKGYQAHRQYYSDYEERCEAALNTLFDVGYISNSEYLELSDQMYHVMRMYKRH